MEFDAMDLLLLALVPCLTFLPIVSIIANIILMLIPLHDKLMRQNLHILIAIFAFTQLLHSTSLLGFLISAIFDVQQLTQMDCFIIQCIPLIGTALSPFVYLAISFQLLISNVNIFRPFIDAYSRIFLAVLLLPALAFAFSLFFSIIGCYQGTAGFVASCPHLQKPIYSQTVTFCAYWSAFDFESDYYFYISVLICVLIALIMNLLTAILACNQRDSFALGLRPALFYYMYGNTVAYSISVLGRVFREFTVQVEFENFTKVLLEGIALWLTSCLPLFLFYRYSFDYNKAIKKLLGRLHESKAETTLSFSRRRSTIGGNDG